MITPESRDNQHLRILLVDDRPFELEMAELLLTDCDSSLSIETTTSPHQAYELVINSDYDCLVTDYQMPEIDGIELARMIRESNDIPIIMFTGWGDESVAEAGYNAGINGYLRKTADLSIYDGLARTIRRVVYAAITIRSPRGLHVVPK